MSDKKQSSVEWLHEQLTLTWYDYNSSKDILDQAKAMHKEEITNSVLSSGYIGGATEEEAEQYYNETFNSDEG